MTHAVTRVQELDRSTPALELGRTAFWDLEHWLASERSMQLGLLGVERETERRGRELLRLQLQAHIDARGTGDLGYALRVRPPAGRSWLYTHKRLHTRRLVTLFGPIAITRLGYSTPGRSAIHPLDAELQLPVRKYSYEVQRRLVKAALQGPFDDAVEMLTDTTGIVMSKRSVEQIVLDAAIDFETFFAQRTTLGSPSEASLLVAAIDSKGIPMVKAELAKKPVRLKKGEKHQKKRMSTVAAVFNQRPQPRTPEDVVARLFSPVEVVCARETRLSRPLHKRVWASLLAGKDVFIREVRDEMLRRDPGREHTWIVVTDGERGLQRRVCEHFQDITLVLDLFHVLEKLWSAAYTLHPEGSPAAALFVQERALRILRGQRGQVVKGLRQMVTKRKLLLFKANTLLD
ncbi:MAG: hypothetical protein ACREXY_20080, partial [Gammaproteobacteria bacterium]